jgi:hypothetical protein
MSPLTRTIFLNALTLGSILIFIINNILAQPISCSTTFGNDSLKVKYSVNGREGLINEPHRIPVGSFPVEQAVVVVRAKDAGDKVKASTLNYRLLDSLVWAECNKYRRGLNLAENGWNDTLYLASVHHSAYQAYFNILGHGETRPLPGRDAEQKHYGKVHPFTAEICLNRPYKDGESRTQCDND